MYSFGLLGALNSSRIYLPGARPVKLISPLTSVVLYIGDPSSGFKTKLAPDSFLLLSAWSSFVILN